MPDVGQNTPRVHPKQQRRQRQGTPAGSEHAVHRAHEVPLSVPVQERLQLGSGLLVQIRSSV